MSERPTADEVVHPPQENEAPTHGDDGVPEGASAGDLDHYDDSEVIEAVLEDLPPEQATVIRKMVARMHTGPLPDPESFAMYEAVCPGAGQQILDYAKRNQDHRFDYDRQLSGTARLSLLCTTLILLMAIVAGVYLGLNGQPVLGALLGGGGLALVLAQMLRGGGRWTGR